MAHCGRMFTAKHYLRYLVALADHNPIVTQSVQFQELTGQSLLGTAGQICVSGNTLVPLALSVARATDPVRRWVPVVPPEPGAQGCPTLP